MQYLRDFHMANEIILPSYMWQNMIVVGGATSLREVKFSSKWQKFCRDLYSVRGGRRVSFGKDSNTALLTNYNYPLSTRQFQTTS